MRSRIRSSLPLIGALVLVTILAAIWFVPDIGVEVGLSALLIGVTAVLLTVRRATARLLTRVGAVDRRVEQNHKRASEWDWRIGERLTAAGIRAVEVPVPATSASTPERTWKTHPLVGRFLETSILDTEYYSAVSGARFQRDEDAAAHYLNIGMEQMHAPSLLVDVHSLPEKLRASMKFGRAEDFVSFWSTDEAAAGPTSDLFDPRCVEDAAARQHPGGPLGWFQSSADDGTCLAVQPENPRSGAVYHQLRQEAVLHHVSVRDSRRLAGPRESTSWDEAREARWRAEASEVVLQEGLTVSVVLPVRDRQSTIAAAIQSVLAQTFDGWELVVVDDGSTDETSEILTGYAEADSRIVIVTLEPSGVSRARNVGLERARGRYVAFLDSDNTWRADYLEMMLKWFRGSGGRAAHAGSRIVRGQGAADVFRAFEGGFDHLRILNHVDMNVLVVERDLALEVGGFDESLRRWVDHDFAIRVARRSPVPLVPIIACDYTHSSDLSDRITVRESDHWQWVVLGKAWVEWPDPTVERVRGRVSVVIPTYNDAEMTLRAAQSVLRDDSWADTEVIVVDNGSNPEVALRLFTGCLGVANLHYRRLPRNLNFAIGSNFGAAAASGELTLFLNNDTLVRRGGLGPLVDRLLRDDVLGVQPVLAYADDTIQTAGTVFPASGALPVHFLAGHALEDSEAAGGLIFSAVTAAAVLLRTRDVVELGGFDPFYVNGMEDVDLCLRMLATNPGKGFAVEPDSVFTHLESKTPGRTRNQTENRRIFLERWATRMPQPESAHFHSCGFEIASIGHDGSPVLAPKIQLARRRGAPRRWGLRIAANAGGRGDGWGDTHFAESLASGLRSLGQQPVTYRHGAHEVDASRFDDVLLALRGLDRVRPHPGKTNVLWVISHPELVTAEELLEYDIVCAASVPWARRMEDLTGKTVHVLLQATDSDRFGPPDRMPPRTGRGVFVGGVHPGRERRTVQDALSLGLPVTVFGPGWEGRVPDDVFGGSYVANDELADVYRRADYVLADHWDDMAADGFIQNRVFDAVAAGARVVSDEVEGLEALFGGAVRTYDTLQTLSEIAGAVEQAFVGDEELRAIATTVAAEHSFLSRARDLVALVESQDLP
ncbi:glycosyltransferase [Sanguibacter suaedae]|uniref:Glycosyltransferase n=1 Tax=Sanguibacter suaedae TaxID=2795737 RepID=A0A934M9I0_9MICO|nr:glycosyltransferase [Sanguibacter suaedae]MBI9114610.1 glycosyltransferase [Sanguibacter suaedae]